MGRYNKSLRIKKAIGISFCVGFLLTFALMMISSILPNPIGQAWDERVFQDARQNINQIRKGIIRIQFKNATEDPIQNTNVNITLSKHEFLFGAMFFHYDESSSTNDLYASMWTDVFNFAVLPFYYSMWDNETSFSEEKRINSTLAYCAEHNITTKGHCLVWNHPAGIPEWLDVESMTQQEIKDHYYNRISSLTYKYRNNISYWDVTNEMLHRKFPKIDSLELFVHNCFMVARNSVPTNNLIINDYGMLGHTFGIGEMERFLARLNALGTPYDIIGMQGHVMDTDWIPSYEIKGTLDGFSKLGKPIHITELMVSSIAAPITNSWKKGTWSQHLQAEFLERLYTTVFGNPACESLLYWGFEDRDITSSRYDGYGLINSDLSPKPAYLTLKRLIKDTWHTDLLNIQTDSEGWVEFEGFYGTYNISIDTHDFQIVSGKNMNNSFVIQFP